MLRQLFILGLLLSVVFISGCTQPSDIGDVTTTTVSESGLEDQAAGMIEQEMEEAIENIDLGDIENSIAE